MITIHLFISNVALLIVALPSGTFAKTTTTNAPFIASKPLVTIYEGPIECADEDKVKEGDYISVVITGKIDETSEVGEKGFQFLDSILYEFQIGKGEVIQGWDIGLMGLCRGTKAAIIVPPYQKKM